MLEVEGRSFSIPAALTAVSSGDRIALALITGGACRFGNAIVQGTMAPGAVDLSLVRTSRCPLLIDHTLCVESLIGNVIGAQLDDGVLRCLVRFARTAQADQLWRMLKDGFALSLSAGCTIEQAVRVGDLDGAPLFRVARWRLREVSVTVAGRDEQAFVRRLNDNEDAATILSDMQEQDRGHEVERALHLDRWRQWATAAGVRMAETLAADRDAVCDALAGEVDRHCASIISDFSP